MDFENLRINYIGFQEYISKGLYQSSYTINKSKPQNEQEININSDNIYKVIKKTVSDALAVVNPKLVKKSTLAKMLDVSVDQIDRLMREQILVEEIHFTRYRPKGDPMFDVAECLAALRPNRAKERVLV
jgi:hypothetical protein